MIRRQGDQRKHSFLGKKVLDSKCLACNAEKNITAEDNKKRMNIVNFINTYKYIYYIICKKSNEGLEVKK